MRRSRFGPALRQPFHEYRNPAEYGFSVWFLRTTGEEEYLRRLGAWMQRRYYAINPRRRVTAKTLHLGSRLLLDFRFLTFTRSLPNIREHLEDLRCVARRRNLRECLVDYYNKEFDFLSQSARPGVYATADLAPATGFFHYPMPPCPTYMAEYLVDDAAFSNPAWKVFCAEHVALLGVAWLREASRRSACSGFRTGCLLNFKCSETHLPSSWATAQTSTTSSLCWFSRSPGPSIGRRSERGSDCALRTTRVGIAPGAADAEAITFVLTQCAGALSTKRPAAGPAMTFRPGRPITRTSQTCAPPMRTLASWTGTRIGRQAARPTARRRLENPIRAAHKG